MVTFDDDAKAEANYLSAKIRKDRARMDLLDRYFDGEQRLSHIGLALPDEVAHDFNVVVNVPCMAVEEPERRQELRGFQRSGASVIDDSLREVWDANNLAAQSSLCHVDEKVYGHSFVAVSANPESTDLPLITVESPRAMAVHVDARGTTRSAMREYRDPVTRQRFATLYLPDTTFWLAMGGSGWEVADRDDHHLGRVPVVMFLNRPRAGRFHGRSEMASVMPLTDAVARLVTNMLVDADTLALPHRWASGVNMDDFVDKDGKQIPKWEAYMTALRVTENPDAKFGSFDAADLANFTRAVDSMLTWCAAVLGLPTRFMGQETTNPASEGAINADEVRLIRNVERMNVRDGASWSWVMDIVERFRTGEWPAPNAIRTVWQNPATPTRAQMADAASKLYGARIISREGVWDEMGWDEPRKDRERAYIRAEAEDAQDPVMSAFMAELSGSTPSGSLD